MLTWLQVFYMVTTLICIGLSYPIVDRFCTRVYKRLFTKKVNKASIRRRNLMEVTRIG